MSFIQSLILVFLIQVIAYTAFLLHRPKYVSEIKEDLGLIRSLNIILLVIIIMLWLIYVMKLISLFSLSIIMSIIISLILYFHTYSSYASEISSKVLLYSLTLLIPLSALVMLGNTYPMIEEGRRLGFAENIVMKGHWVPYTFHGNNYYQFFQVVAAFLATILAVTDINPFILRKILCIIATLFLLILAIIASKKVGKIYLVSFSPIILITSPMLTYLFMNYANGSVGTILALFNIIVFLIFNDQRILFLVPVISVTGVLTHGVYPIYITPFLILLYMISRNDPNARRIYAISLTMVIIITLVYWVFSVVLKSVVVKVITDYLRELSRLITQPFEARLGYTPWYAYLDPTSRTLLTVSWTFILSLAFSFIVRELIERAKAKEGIRGIRSMLNEKAVLLALLSFTLFGVPALWYLVTGKRIMGIGFPHFYGLAFLCIPLACKALSEIVVKHKATLLLSLVIMGLVAYGAMQDPRYNVASPALGVASERDWTTGITIKKLKERNIISAGDIRLASPFLYMGVIKGELKYNSTRQRYIQYYLVTVAHDIKGVASIERELFFQKHPWIRELILTDRYLNHYDIVFNDGFYSSVLLTHKP